MFILHPYVKLKCINFDVNTLMSKPFSPIEHRNYSIFIPHYNILASAAVGVVDH